MALKRFDVRKLDENQPQLFAVAQIASIVPVDGTHNWVVIEQGWILIDSTLKWLGTRSTCNGDANEPDFSDPTLLARGIYLIRNKLVPLEARITRSEVFGTEPK